MNEAEQEALIEELLPDMTAALRLEFPFMDGTDESWEKAARGVLKKLGPRVMEITFVAPDRKRMRVVCVGRMQEAPA